MKSRRTGLLLTTMLLVAWCMSAAPADGQTALKNICRVKGQEENTLQGLGIVVGLKGSGDGSNFLPAVRTLAKAMTLMGTPLSKTGLADLKDTKNVALVAVTATVPAAGARQGDKLDCMISSIGSAKSLAGGRLLLTPLVGPDQSNPRIYAFAEGSITLDNATMSTTGRIFRGCRLEEDFFNAFTRDGKITLVLDKNHADFQVAQDVAELINAQLGPQSGGAPLARALNQLNIEVLIPPQYRDEPVMFISQVLSRPMVEPQTGPRVVINERTGSIVISGDAEIGPVVVTHKNITIETGTAAAGPRFVAIDPGDASKAKLKALVEALNGVHVPADEIIDIIKGLDRNGKLYGQLIIE